MKWLRISFESALTHAVPAELAPQLIAEMSARGHAIKNYEKAYGVENARSLGGNPKDITSWSFDMGGMMAVNRPYEHVDIDGLNVDVPCEHLSLVLSRLQRLDLRRFDDGARYYKLHHWNSATVMSPAQYRRVHYDLSTLVPIAEARAESFDAATIRAIRQGGLS